LRFLLPRTQLHRVPLAVADSIRRPRRTGEGRQTPAGAVLRVLAPLDGSGSLCSRRVQDPCEPRRVPWPPMLRGLVSCRSRPWNVPSELSLPEEPYPLSRATCFRASSFPITADAEPPGVHDRFRRMRQLFARATLPEEDRGRMSRDYGFPRSLDRPPGHARKHACSNRPSRRHWARRVSDRHARFEALLPPGVRSRFRSRSPGQGGIAESLLSWASSPSELAPPRFRIRSLAAPHAAGQALYLVRLREASRLATLCETRPPTPRFHEPGIRRHARSIEPHTPPSGSNPAPRVFREHP